MTRHVVLLRGINLGSRNRIAMPELRALLEAAGYEDVQTYLQSGNVVVSSGASADAVARDVERCLERGLGLDIAVVRTRDDGLRAALGADAFADAIREDDAALTVGRRARRAGPEAVSRPRCRNRDGCVARSRKREIVAPCHVRAFFRTLGS